MSRPPALPRPVPFPVYGLAEDQPDDRWLLLWNEPAYLWTVTLRHGPVFGDGITIETLRKQACPRRDTDKFPPLPVRLDSAALVAVQAAALASARSGSGGRRSFADIMDAELALIEIDANDVTLNGWDEATVRVDGQAVHAHMRDVGSQRAVVVDLPEVFIALAAPSDTDPNGLVLVDVRERLDDYPWP